MVPVENVVHLFECLLAERRIILAANKLGVVSNCITALTGLLYPLTWQHIFIPVLPDSLLAYCAAPMPFLVGAMKWSLKEILSMPLEEVVILDCDTGDFFKDHECRSLPQELRSSLEQDLRRLVLSDRQGEPWPETASFQWPLPAALVSFLYSLPFFALSVTHAVMWFS